MKTFFLTTAFVLSLVTMVAQNATEATSGTTITVTIPVPRDGGSVIAGLYNQDTFMKAAPLQGQESTITEGFASITFTNVAPGTYAITLFHDTNENKIMDFEPNGMPKEMYGVSNNPMSYGPPQWKDAKFEVSTAPIALEIRL